MSTTPDPGSFATGKYGTQDMQPRPVQADQEDFLVREFVARWMQSMNLKQQMRQKKLELSFQRRFERLLRFCCLHKQEASVSHGNLILFGAGASTVEMGRIDLLDKNDGRESM